MQSTRSSTVHIHKTLEMHFLGRNINYYVVCNFYFRSYFLFSIFIFCFNVKFKLQITYTKLLLLRCIPFRNIIRLLDIIPALITHMYHIMNITVAIKKLQITNYKLQITNYKLQATNCKLQITYLWRRHSWRLPFPSSSSKDTV